jgi:uncharacterized protein YcbK (DUF882 family)
MTEMNTQFIESIADASADELPPSQATATAPASASDLKFLYKYKTVNGINAAPKDNGEQQQVEMSKLDELLENEKKNIKTESWNKLDNGIKMQKLHIYAEHYGKENKLSTKDIRALKMFFNDCLAKNKLQKTKEINYEKNIGVIQNIPSLVFNNTSKNFTLKNLDNKRVSTLKSLTPRKVDAGAGAEGSV